MAALAAAGLLFANVPPHEVHVLRAPMEVPKSVTATVIFGGDMMFDRTIREVSDKKGGDFLFSCIDTELQKADLVIANLEGPITAEASRSVGSHVGAPDNYVFTFPVSTASLLYAHNIRVVNLGNNHIYNFGTGGILSTIASLEGASVDYFGDPIHATVVHKNLGGIRLALINYNEFVNHGSSSTTVEQITAARTDGEIPVVYTHWGVEYATTSFSYSRELAHSFIDAGAEIVIGSHPHVVEESELYKGKYIYYSLGNFIFDQYWNEDVRTGLLLVVTFNGHGVAALREIPIHLERDRRTCPLGA